MNAKKNIEQSIARLEKSIDGLEADEAGALEVNAIISLVVGLIVLSIMLPVALTEIMDVNTTGWDSSVASVWGLLPVLAVLAGLVMIVAAYKKR